MQVTKIIPPRHRNVIHSVWRIDLDQEKIKNGYYYLPDNYSEIIISLKSNLKRMVVGTPQVAKIDKGGCYLATTRSKGMMLMSAEDTSFVLIKLHPIRQHMVYGSKDFQTRNGVYDIPIPVTEKLAWDRAIAKTDATTITHLICNFLDVLIDAPTRK
ncbi:MAG: hypothetical protein KI790_08000, partial [Cyclobacteriaceae bacterium]|nr:hypothetical protein [Cyclobacteriaceae bacterium HetDA_MAG_MS6]